MRGLSARDLLDLWERGVETAEVDRGLLMLSYCLPERSWEQLAAVSIGQRDGMVAELRQATLGPMLGALAVCPECKGQLEFDVNPRELGLAAPAEEEQDKVHRFHEGQFSVLCRLPNSTDLHAARGCSDVEAARRLIFSRCVQKVEADGQSITADAVPDPIVNAFASYLAQQDPAAEIALLLECPSCSACWELSFDIISFFWREIQSASRRIVLEVDALARSYGWAEADILNMSSSRRQLYLEMVG